MISTSAAYKQAIKADTETTRLQAEFAFAPDDVISGAVPSSTNQAPISQIAQIKDAQKTMPRWATYEKNRWILDGNATLLPADFSSQETGYWSDSFCDSNGNFDQKPYFDYVLDKAYSLVGVTLFFDDLGEEWATSITVQYLNASGFVIAENTFAGASPILGVEMIFEGVKTIRAIINSWSVPERRAKIVEFLPGEVFIFDPENSFSFTYSEHINPFNTSLEFPEFTINFDNSNKRFDIVNPRGLMKYLRKLMQVSSKIGILTKDLYEYIKIGDFYLFSWPDNTQEDEAALTCKPRLALINKQYANDGRGTQTVAQAAAIIFGIAGITNYSVDQTLQGITVNQYIGENVPIINALGQLAVAAGGYWKFERDGSYVLRPYSVPAASNVVDYDGMWSKPSIEQSTNITAVNVKYYACNGESLEEHDNTTSTTENDGSSTEISSCFVPSPERSSAIGALALDFFSRRLQHTISYRGDMSIEPGDTITTQNDYGESDILVTDHTITWDAENKLSGEIAGKGAT